MAKRVSLTKAQELSAAGAELIALCQTITEDGTLSLDEIRDLMRWLNEHADADLPAKDFLFDTVKRIVEDRRITKEEQKELYQAIETVLPSTFRKEAVANRKEFEAEIKHREKIETSKRKEQEKVERELERERERVERERNRPLLRANFMIAGARHEGRLGIIASYAREGDPVYLARDKANRFSRHAIEIRLGNGLQIGFVPEEHASDYAPLLDAGHPQLALISHLWQGRDGKYPVIDAEIYRLDANEPALIYPEQIPAKSRLA